MGWPPPRLAPTIRYWCCPPAESGDEQSGSELVIINPLLELEHADLVYDWEGCLSVPGLKGLVPRCPKVRLRGLNARG